jgi:hypothetical protein
MRWPLERRKHICLSSSRRPFYLPPYLFRFPSSIQRSNHAFAAIAFKSAYKTNNNKADVEFASEKRHSSATALHQAHLAAIWSFFCSAQKIVRRLLEEIGAVALLSERWSVRRSKLWHLLPPSRFVHFY